MEVTVRTGALFYGEVGVVLYWNIKTTFLVFHKFVKLKAPLTFLHEQHELPSVHCKYIGSGVDVCITYISTNMHFWMD